LYNFKAPQMKAALYNFENEIWLPHPDNQIVNEHNCALVLCFTSKSKLKEKDIYSILRKKFPIAAICLCSTAGEIHHSQVLDDSVSVTALEFSSTTVKANAVNIDTYSNSFEAGISLGRQSDGNGLKYLMVLCDGNKVNGSELIRGMNTVIPNNIPITGGLAGDGDRFESTLVGLNGTPGEGVIAAIGFYGEKLKIGHGSRGGWDTFGLEKVVTKSTNNVLFEMDGQNALDIYKRYLGPDAEQLPGAALLFPLAVVLPGAAEPIVRTILSVDNNAGSMTFAGDIPVGAKVRFMRANFDKLVVAASEAASQSFIIEGTPPDYALLISCVGRKIILRSRIEEEIESIDNIFGHQTLLSGFYSYGELSPLIGGSNCQLHNQTMTITTFHEVE
jgi:hypothetical protein